MKKKRRKFAAAFKAKVAIEALKEQKSLAELSELYEVHPQQISKWKREFLENASSVFEREKEDKSTVEESEKLYKKIGQLQVEVDFLKKKLY